MHKIKVKTKFKVGEEVLLKDEPHPGWSRLTKIEYIIIEEHTYGISIKYKTPWGIYSEDSIESTKEFNDRYKKQMKDFSHYVDWVDKQDFVRQ